MKRIVDGRMYNSETADLVGSLSRGGTSDFQYERTGLYRTKRGQFFLAGEGGALSRWGRQAPFDRNGLIGGEGVLPLDPKDALDFAEKADVDAELIAVYFDDLVVEA